MRRLGSQCVDLVVCDVTSQVVAVVEIRPSTAQLTEGVRRRLDRVSRVLKGVGIPLHVWNQDSLPSVEAARATIAPKMPAVPLELAARRVAAQAAAPTVDEGQNPFEDTDRNWSPDEGIEVSEVREPTASTWFDELDSVPRDVAAARPWNALPPLTHPCGVVEERRVSGSPDQRVCELARAERLQVFELLADPDEVDRERRTALP